MDFSVPQAPKSPGFGRYTNLLVTLGHPTRLSVLEALSKGSLHVQEIQAQVRVERTLLSHHLRCLRKAGLVEARREGQAIRYRLASAIARALETRCIPSDCCELRFERSRKESALCSCHTFPLMVAICLLSQSTRIGNLARSKLKETRVLALAKGNGFRS